jgi:hypothetical protein
MRSEPMTMIEPLNLTQDRVNLDSGESPVRWYGWSTPSGVTWDLRPVNGFAGRGPDYACDVRLPGLMAGDAGEIRADVAAALRRHSRALGLN